MKIKELLVYVLLVTGIVALFGGFALVSRGMTYGWAGVAFAVPMLFIVQRNMRPAKTEDAEGAEAPSADTTTP